MSKEKANKNKKEEEGEVGEEGESVPAKFRLNYQ